VYEGLWCFDHDFSFKLGKVSLLPPSIQHHVIFICILLTCSIPNRSLSCLLHLLLPSSSLPAAAIAISNRSKHQLSNGKSVKVVGAKISGHVGRLTRNGRRRLQPDSQALSSVRLMAVCRRGVSTNAAGAADACGHEGIVEPGLAALRAAEGAVVEFHAAEGRREWGWGVFCGLFR
jgi:hypothetical protein